jgi:O-antigen/teichoic acid export membrane protein
MLGGFAFAQVISIAAMPLLTRIYSPEAFGFQALLVSIATVLSLAATLRLDLAILLATDEEEGRLLGLIGCATASVLIVLAVALLVFDDQIAVRAGAASPGWLWLLLPMTAALVSTQVATALLSRTKQFRLIARATVFGQGSYVLAAVALVASFTVHGLAFGKTIGLAAGAISLVPRGNAARSSPVQAPTARRLAGLWSRFHQFVVFNAPYSLISTLTREMPIYLFTAVSANAAAGFYGLARMLMTLPALFSTAALSQVFYREAAELWGTPRLEALVSGLLGLSMRASALLFAFMAVWGDILFQFVFGAQWQQAGIYAMILAPSAWLAVQTGWPERMFEVATRQDVSFKIQMTFDVLTIAAVIIPLVLQYDPVYAVAGWALANTLFHLSYLTAIFKISAFDIWLLRRILFSSIALFAGGCAIFAAGRVLIGESPITASIFALIASAFALVTVVKSVPYLRTIAGSPEAAA